MSMHGLARTILVAMLAMAPLRANATEFSDDRGT
jgi:hypothetical protein